MIGIDLVIQQLRGDRPNSCEHCVHVPHHAIECVRGDCQWERAIRDRAAGLMEQLLKERSDYAWALHDIACNPEIRTLKLAVDRAKDALDGK